MTPDEFNEAMKIMQEEYDYFIDKGDIREAQNVLYEMNCLEANYGRGE